MRTYVTPLGAAHLALGLATSGLGALPCVLASLLAAYAAYDCLDSILFLISGPEYWSYAFQSLISTWTMAAVIAAGGAAVLAAGLVELFAGVALLRRWPSAHPAVVVALVPNLALGVLGLLVSVGALMVLADPDVRREFRRDSRDG